VKDDNTKFIRTGHILPKIWQHPTWLAGWLISINSTVTSERRQQHRVMDNGSRVQLKAPFSGLFFLEIVIIIVQGHIIEMDRQHQ